MRRRDVLTGLYRGALGSAVAGLAGACSRHSHNPSAANPVPTPQKLTVVSGRTGMPVTGQPDTAVVGSTLSLSADGFLTLRTAWDGGDVLLWPDDADLPVDYTRAFVYNHADPGTLHRLPSGIGTVAVQTDASIPQGSRMYDELINGAALLSAAHPSLEYAVGGVGQFSVAVTVDPADPGFVQIPGAGALTYVQNASDGSIAKVRTVARGELEVFYTWDNVRTMFAHELCHGTGLAHSPHGLMAATVESYGNHDFTATEKLVMKLHYSRRNGTQLAATSEDENPVRAQSFDTRWHLVCAL